MKKWTKYTCYCITWWWEQITQWVFEIIMLTDKTCKLEQIKEWFFNYVSRFFWKENEIITIKWDIKSYIKEEFTRYDKGCWMPFIFNII